jgi:hypothetical protein
MYPECSPLLNEKRAMHILEKIQLKSPGSSQDSLAHKVG